MNSTHLQSFMEAIFQDLSEEGENIPGRPSHVLCKILSITDEDRVVRKYDTNTLRIISVDMSDYDNYDVLMTTLCTLRALWRMRALQMIENSGADDIDDGATELLYIIHSDISGLVAHLNEVKVAIGVMFKDKQEKRLQQAKIHVRVTEADFETAQKKYNDAVTEQLRAEQVQAALDLLSAGPVEQLAQAIGHEPVVDPDDDNSDPMDF